MTLSIHVLGDVSIRRNGSLIDPPKGRKVWALLAYLLLSRAPSRRDHLASLLFGEADDPLRALRWNLTELRRALGPDILLEGEPVSLSLPPGAYVDVLVSKSGTWVEAAQVPGLGRELLEGMQFPSSPSFEAWLLNERRHVKASAEAVLREAAMFRIAAGDAEGAIDHAARLVASDPLDETYQALLIRAYAAAGDRDAAARQLAACVELFRKELGIEPGPNVTSAADVSFASTTTGPLGGRPAVRAQLEAGEAAIKAGALDAGIECLRRVTAEAHLLGDLELKARTLFAMGTTLVHCGRFRYEEGAVALHEAAAIAERLDDDLMESAAYREIAWVELLTCRYQRMEVLLNKALELAGEDPDTRAGALWVLGTGVMETGRYGAAIEHLEEAVRLAMSADQTRHLVPAFSMLGKARMMRGDFTGSRAAFERALSICDEEGWAWMKPWPESYFGQLELHEGMLERAEELFEHAFALGRQYDDPCFKAKGSTGLGLLAAERGDVDAAAKLLQEAQMYLIRTPDHTWTLAYALDALCKVAARYRLPEAPRWINDLEALAGRTGLREFVAWSYLYRYELGDRGALETAELLASEMESPFVHQAIRAATMTV